MEKICLIGCESRGVIAPEIYGHFAEHIGGVYYDGLWVGEDSPVENIRGFRKFIVEKFRAIHPPVLRWPGGCFAETYNWRDGIGPRECRPKTVNWWYNYDHRVESNAVGAHEFMDFCEQVGARPYVAANITAQTPMDMRSFMEYLNMPENTTTLAAERAENGHPAPFDVPYFGIGNENWGGGGNMTPEQYAREYVKYATICGSVNVNGAKYIACGADSWNVDWTERFMREFAHRCPIWGLAFHYYCGRAGDPVSFTREEWDTLIAKASQMETLIERHNAAMLAHDPDKRIKIVVDEWGCWHPDGSGPSGGYNLFEQQSTMRDAVITALTLNIFNNHCDRIAMANVAQLCNNLHCLFLAGGEHAIVTPTYHVYDLYKGHQGGEQIEVAVTDKSLSVSASEKDGVITVTAANTNYDKAIDVEISAFARELGTTAEITVLAADPHAHNTFENPDAVVPGAAQTCSVGGGVLAVTVPASGIVRIEIR
ncbi:MAG: alpha-N-arabinofuranosidase [Ruminococcaceae bacterium]|nr:alpha-N-arabinofuranosidase [Oscillospiraceae bacterium]